MTKNNILKNYSCPEVQTDSVPEFELVDTAADIQQGREEREARERDAQKQGGEARREEEARTEETLARGGSCSKKAQNQDK